MNVVAFIIGIYERSDMRRELRALAIKAKIVNTLRSGAGEFMGVYEIAKRMGISRNCVFGHCVSLVKKNPSHFEMTITDYRNGAIVIALDPNADDIMKGGNFNELSLVKIFDNYIGKHATYKQLRLPLRLDE